MRIGGIYTDEKCPICGGRLCDNAKDGLYCKTHPEQKAKTFRIQFKGLDRRFKDYDNASQTLEGWRYKFREGLFDKRDYRKDNPLGFETLATEWLKDYQDKVDQGDMTRKSFRCIEGYVKRISVEWGNRNVKSLAELELKQLDKSLSREYSSKTVNDIFIYLKSFFKWAKKYYIKSLEIPEFPEISVKMKFRKPITKEDQFRIIDEIKRIAPEKVHLAILWLATYPAIRPGEMQSLRECDIDLNLGKFVFLKHKTSDKTGVKMVSMLPEDIEIARSMLSVSELRMLPFFRLPGKRTQFCNSMLGFYWRRACANLKIEGTSLYPGTKHSSIMALRKKYSPESIKKIVQINSDAFDRYLQMDESDERELFASARGADVIVTLKNASVKKGNE